MGPDAGQDLVEESPKYKQNIPLDCICPHTRQPYILQEVESFLALSKKGDNSHKYPYPQDMGFNSHAVKASDREQGGIYPVFCQCYLMIACILSTVFECQHCVLYCMIRIDTLYVLLLARAYYI